MDPRIDIARRLCDRLNAGQPVLDTIADFGIEGEVSSEDSSVFALDDLDNNIIDFGWDGDSLVLVWRSGDARRGTASPWEVRHTTRVS